MDGMPIRSRIHIDRPYFDQKQLRKNYKYQNRKESSFTKYFRSKRYDYKCEKIVENMFPIFKWMNEYSWKSDLLSDIITGFTVSVMQIPQGMAYALLSNVPPILGLYMGFFPVLVYAVLGTYRYNSIGTVGIISVMVRRSVVKYSSQYQIADPNLTLGNGTHFKFQNVPDYESLYSSVQVATAVTFGCGIFQIIMYILGLGVISTILSDPLVTGFTTGAAIEVITSQVKDLLGLSIPNYKGHFVTVKIWNKVFREIGDINYISLLISSTTLAVFILNNSLFKPYISKYTSFPVPVELIVMLLGTVISRFLELHYHYGINIIGEIPTGLPATEVPCFELIQLVAFDALMIAIVSHSLSVSMGILLSENLDDKTNANQEFLALGTGNILGSFFSCLPVSASITRSIVQKNVGGKTQMASIVSSILFIFILLWIGPLFEPLPSSVLASLIVFTCKGLLCQASLFWPTWRKSKIDGFIWLSTFLTSALVGVDIGLLVGCLLSLMSLLLLGLQPYTCLLGHIPNTELFLDVTKYKLARELPGIKIFHYNGAINFITKTHFSQKLHALLKLDDGERTDETKDLDNILNNVPKTVDDKTQTKESEKQATDKYNWLKFVILDFSSVTYIDPSGVEMITKLIINFSQFGVLIYIASCSDHVYNMFEKCSFNLNNISTSIFPTVSDAVQDAKDKTGYDNFDTSFVSTVEYDNSKQ